MKHIEKQAMRRWEEEKKGNDKHENKVFLYEYKRSSGEISYK
jgi:hypothetical protein